MESMPIGDAIRRNAEADPNRPAITDHERTVTRGELDRRTNALASAYADLGVTRDRLVTIALPNGIEFYEASIACWKLGATPQPVSYRLPSGELNAIVELADPPLVIGATHPTKPSIPAGFEPPAGTADDPLPSVTAKWWKAPTSGGSTGRPKIIVSGQDGTTSPGMAMLFRLPQDGVQLVCTPLYHNSPFLFSMTHLYFGAHLIVMPRFDAAQSLELIERHRVHWTWLVPTIMHRIWRLPEAERNAFDPSSLETVLHGAAPCPEWLKQAWIDWLGPDRILELYAGTEAQTACVISGGEWLQHRGSVGRPLSEITIRDADGTELEHGEVGEIWFRRPQTPTYHYVGADRRELEDWESIGDMGWMDDDGYLYIADRRTDLILAGGANIYPAEVEAALEEHPAVRSCAVIGLPDPDLGQRVHAIVQLDRDASDDELASFVAERLVRYKVPRSFERVDEPLRDEAGKVRRSQLRDARIR